MLGMVAKQRRVQQYASRKRTGKKPISLPGGISRETRKKLKSVSKNNNSHERGRVAEGLIHLETQHLIQRNITRRYVSIERVLDTLHLNSPLKRQAVHAACDAIAHEIRDIADHIADFTAKHEVLCLKRDLLQKPELFEPKMVRKLMLAYDVRKNDSIEKIELQIHFLSKMIQTDTRELREIYEKPPHAFISIFGKASSQGLWRLFRDIVYPNAHQK